MSTRDDIRDLIVDIRCARRDGLDGYAQECARKLRDMWPKRHGPTPRHVIAGEVAGVLRAVVQGSDE